MFSQHFSLRVKRGHGFAASFGRHTLTYLATNMQFQRKIVGKLFFAMAVLVPFSILSAIPPTYTDMEINSARLDKGGRLFITVSNTAPGSNTAAPALAVHVDHVRVRTLTFPEMPQVPSGTSVEIDTKINLSRSERRIVAVIDPQNVINELSEYQNIKAWVIPTTSTRTGFDLSITAFVSASPHKLGFRIKNQGNQTSPPNFPITINAYLPGSPTPTPYLATIPMLSPGIETTVTTNTNVTAGGPITVRAELTHVAFGGMDLDTSNNVFDARIRYLTLGDVDTIYGSRLNNANIQAAMRWQPLCSSPPTNPPVNTCQLPYLTYGQWPADLQGLLKDALFKLEQGGHIPPIAKPTTYFLSPFRYVLEQDAKAMYVAHVAHALWLDLHGAAIHGINWSLASMTPTQLNATGLNASFQQAYLSNGTWQYYIGSFWQWSPRTTYDFLSHIGAIRSDQSSTVFSIVDWWRANASHGSPSIPIPIEEFFYSLQARLTGGCGPTGSMLRSMANVLNIPAEITTITFGYPAVPNCPGGESPHVAMHFHMIQKTPAELMGGWIGHNDQINTGTLASVPIGRQVVPSNELVYSPSETDSLLDWPNSCAQCQGYPNNPDGPATLQCDPMNPSECNSCSQQVWYNVERFERLIASDYLPGGWLSLRCEQDGLAKVDELLRVINLGSPEYALPLLDSAERADFIADLDSELVDLGGVGGLQAGCAWINARKDRFDANQRMTYTGPTGSNTPPVPNVGKYPFNAPVDTYPVHGQGSLVTLFGKATDTDGPGPVTFLWSPLASGITVNSATQSPATFTVPLTGATSYVMRLTAYDGADMAYQNVTIDTSLPLNSPPTVFVEGCRYLGVIPVAAAGNAPVAFRVTSNCVNQFIKSDGTLGSTLLVSDYKLASEWGTIHLRGDKLTPNRAYWVSMIPWGGNEVPSAYENGTLTWRWGDANGSGGNINLYDTLAITSYISGNPTATCSAQSCDISGSSGCFAPNLLVNVTDLQSVVLAQQQGGGPDAYYNVCADPCQ